jgi:hypothetical protein
MIVNIHLKRLLNSKFYGVFFKSISFNIFLIWYNSWIK